MTPVLELSKVKLMRGAKQVLDVVNLSIKEGELAAVMGPNGAGKSTLLQVINLLIPTSGKINFYGQDVKTMDKKALRRRCSLVFQDALVLRDTVFNNVALPLKLRGQSMKKVAVQVVKALEAFNCQHLAGRLAHRLSCGEAQRVCLARALVCEPDMLLLDEPFAQLDPAARFHLGQELKAIAHQRKMTVLMVSHNLDDVLFLTRRVIVLQNGRIVQDSSPEEMLRRPVNREVARLVGMDNVLPCMVRLKGSETEIQLPNGFSFACKAGIGKPKEGHCCLPGDIFCRTMASDGLDEKFVFFEAKVKLITPGIGIYYAQVDFCGLSLNLKVTRETALHLKPEDTIKLAFDPQEAHLLYQ